MDSYNDRSHSRSGRVKQKLDRLAHLAELDPRIGEHATALLDYAQRLKIDAKKLRAEVVKALKPVSAGK